jgi:glycosyltransferase involved in cell wall biosynthesis
LFLFVGNFESDDYEKLFNEMIDKYQLNDFAKHIPQQEKIEKWFAAADILLLPSYEGSEGMGRVIFEAMACGTVPVGTNISGVNEAITTDTGILVNEHSPDEIAEAITKLLDDRSLLDNMRENGLKRSRDVFDITKHARNVENFYLKIMKK